MALLSLGSSSIITGHYQQAIDLLRTSIEIAQREGNRKGEASGYRLLGDAMFASGLFIEALVAQNRALAITQDIGDSYNESVLVASISKTRREVDQMQIQDPLL